jgi:hypothetical protein
MSCFCFCWPRSQQEDDDDVEKPLIDDAEDRIVVWSLGGERHIFTTGRSEEWSVKDLKQAIQGRIGVPVAKQYILFAEEEDPLPDDKSLQSLPLNEDEEIELCLTVGRVEIDDASKAFLPLAKRDGTLECYMKRKNIKDHSEYELYREGPEEEEARFILCSKMDRTKLQSLHYISAHRGHARKGSPHLLATLRGNLLGTEFAILGHGVSARDPQEELGLVSYKSNRFTNKPRELQVWVPKVDYSAEEDDDDDVEEEEEKTEEEEEEEGEGGEEEEEKGGEEDNSIEAQQRKSRMRARSKAPAATGQQVNGQQVNPTPCKGGRGRRRSVPGVRGRHELLLRVRAGQTEDLTQLINKPPVWNDQVRAIKTPSPANVAPSANVACVLYMGCTCTPHEQKLSA